MAQGPRGPIRGECQSLSQGGMFFAGPTLPVGHQVELMVQLPAFGAVKAVGEVRYHRAEPLGAGMGVRFTRLGQADLSRITEFVGN